MLSSLSSFPPHYGFALLELAAAGAASAFVCVRATRKWSGAFQFRQRVPRMSFLYRGPGKGYTRQSSVRVARHIPRGTSLGMLRPPWQSMPGIGDTPYASRPSTPPPTLSTRIVHITRVGCC